jgi:hypothetical protein
MLQVVGVQGTRNAPFPVRVVKTLDESLTEDDAWRRNVNDFTFPQLARNRLSTSRRRVLS